MGIGKQSKPTRVYADKSVFGGPFDPQFAKASKEFFEEVGAGVFRLVLSALTIQELLAAPERVRAMLDTVPPERIEIHEISDEMKILKDAYLSASILGPGSDADATHVAAATVLNADMIISWNFKHIVHFEKIRGFNAINRLRGYKEIEIYSPLEIV